MVSHIQERGRDFVGDHADEGSGSEGVLQRLCEDQSAQGIVVVCDEGDKRLGSHRVQVWARGQCRLCVAAI